MVPRALVEHPAAQTFLERSEAKALLKVSKVIGIGSVKQGYGDAQPTMVGKRDSVEMNRKALALR